ncbi:MAG: VWA domain-containing protein, partial [Kiritimatiellia bacterium]
GKSSFGAGGYFDSPVDPLLPVSMELKEEDRKLTVAIAIVMDRSGSMTAMGNGGMSKMELANAGAARAIELMGEMDSVTVFAVDTEAHEILPLRQVGRQRERLTSLVRRIQSNGGGIYVFNGLEAAWKQLRNAPQPRRHVILFADAADAEQPEGVDGLIKEMIQKQTTVSVIALGQESDADAPFLEQIAEDGQGRLFFNQDAATLPAVFAQETVSVSRSAFLEDQTAAEPLAGWQELAAGALDWPPQVDGYNLSYLREGAAESLRTLDRYAAPLLAHWQRGAGRVVAVSMPLGGPFSQGMRDWSEYGDFVRTLSRWSMRGEMPSGLALRLHRVGEVLQVKLYADASWQEEFALQPPELRMISTLEDGVQHQAWRRIRPGLLQTEIPLRASERVQGAIRIGKEVLPFGPVNGMAGAEWEMNPRMRRQLQLLSAQSGGETRTDLAEIWNSPPRRNLQGTGKFWLTAGFLLFLVEAVWSRLAGHPLRFGFQWKRGRRERTSGNALKKPEPSPNNVAAAAVRRRSAFQKAKSPGRRSGSRYGQEKPG